MTFTVTMPDCVITVDLSSVDATTNSLTKFQKGFHSDAESHRTALKGLIDGANSRTFQMYGGFFQIAQELLKPENRDLMVSVLRYHGIGQPRVHTNPFTPLAQMAFGKWKKVDTTGKKSGNKKKVRIKHNNDLYEFTPYSQASRVGRAAQWFEFKGWAPKDVAANIEAYPGKMSGILKDARNRFGERDFDDVLVEQAKTELLNQASAASIGLALAGLEPADAKDRKYVAVWGEIQGGKVMLKGGLDIKDETIVANVERQAKNKLKKISDADLGDRVAKALAACEEAEAKSSMTANLLMWNSEEPEIQSELPLDENAA